MKIRDMVQEIDFGGIEDIGRIIVAFYFIPHESKGNSMFTKTCTNPVAPRPSQKNVNRQPSLMEKTGNLQEQFDSFLV
ncbi:MAG: hypothetical protein ACD_67C00206G0001, partial [uncultured bacterium]